MSHYYPQAAVTLRVLWEDFGQGQVKLQELYSLQVLARSVEVHINDYTQADTFALEIDYKQFPFDPRAMRSCGVTIAMENMAHRRGTDPDVQIVPNKENEIFIGFADEDEISFNEESRTVRLEGRDFTALLIDEKYAAGPVNLGKPLDVILREILDRYKATKPLQIDNRVKEDLPNLGQLCPDFNETGQMKNVKKNESPWDVIQDLVSRAGLIAYIELDKLVLSKPRTLYDEKQAKRFVYGKNLRELKLKRKIGRMKNFNVAVRSLSIETKEVLLARIPKEATEAWSKATGIPAKEVTIPRMLPNGARTGTTVNPNSKNSNAVRTQVVADDGKTTFIQEDDPAPYLTFRLANVKSKTHLIEVGQKIFEEIGRQQLEGSMETLEMETMDSNNNCFDLLKIRNGTPVQIQIEQGDMEGLNALKSTSERTRFLLSRGYGSKVAATFAETLGRFPMIFYTKAAKFSLSDTGFKLSIDFINFIELPQKGYGQ